jgi:integrase
MSPRTVKRRKLSASFVASLKVPPRIQETFYDTDPPCFGIRVSASAKSYVIYTRLPGSSSPMRLALGDAKKMNLAVARKKAREWLDLIEQGKDPRVLERETQVATQRTQRTTFAFVVQDFIADKLPSERKGKQVERDIRRNLLPPWGNKPITEITELDVLAVIRAKKATAPVQARNLLGLINRLFVWVIDQRSYGLMLNPCANLQPSKIIGKKIKGDRVLTEGELFALWRNVGRLGYPYCEVYRLLMLTGLRLNEVADANWSEFDPPKREWIIPAERMKGRTGDVKAHLVPLTDDMMEILESLPRFNQGTYLFSFTSGASPIWIGTIVKRRLDARMRRTLRVLARSRGEELVGREPLSPWTNHDIRRSVRSQLSRLKIPEEVREAVLAHARPGIKGVYDHHDYIDEKREALQLWGARLRSIVEPQPSNVVKLRA